MYLIERPVADEPPSLAQLFPVFRQGVLKRQVCLVVVELAARALQRTSLGFDLGLGLGKLLLHFGNVDDREHLTRLHATRWTTQDNNTRRGDFGERSQAQQ